MYNVKDLSSSEIAECALPLSNPHYPSFLELERYVVTMSASTSTINLSR